MTSKSMEPSIKRLLIAFSIFLHISSLNAQITRQDYALADSLEKFRDLVYNDPVSPTWIEKSRNFWYKINTRTGKQYFLVDASKGQKKLAFEEKMMFDRFNAQFKTSFTQRGNQIKELVFSKDLKKITFVLDSFRYSCQLDKYVFSKEGKIRPEKAERHWGETDDEWKGAPVFSNDSNWVAYIKDYNVFIKNRKTGKENQLSFDGSEGEFYAASIIWSPDSKYLVTNHVRANARHFIYFVESSPKNQLQPVLQKREYLKPGDALPIRKPALFSVNEMRQIPVDMKAFENQFDLGNIQWWKDNRAFTFEFNQRGHQLYQVGEVDPKSGGVRILIEETSPTFIDYSSKHYRHDVKDGKEIIWASERDGWNHLYLYDGITGMVKNQITKGEWVVREVIHVNDSARYVIFAGSGKNPDEDPYLIHYYRVSFDGTQLTDLTPEKANHEASFSEDYTFFTDHFSTVGTAPSTLLRRVSDGKTVLALENADITDLLAKGYQFPEVFTTKARDGKTDIWGNIYLPVHLDSHKKYPVIEYIYAGPQDAFAAKSFNPYFSPVAGLAELGFIVVQIDGMGTSCRSKAFHDVCWKNLKDAGFPDRILWMKAAAEKYSFMDTTRVGIFGGSAGGQNALAAVLFHPEFYKAAAASCGCHDNRMDKMWWNEQWMGYPIGPQYAECSNVENAWRLNGHLLLIVGEVDDNVDPASTMQVANALINAKKDFDLLVLPGVNHTLGGKYGERKRRDFFVKYLLNQNPPEWNQ